MSVVISITIWNGQRFTRQVEKVVSPIPQWSNLHSINSSFSFTLNNKEHFPVIVPKYHKMQKALKRVHKTETGKNLFLFIYKAILQRLPSYLSALLSRNVGRHCTRSQTWLSLQVPKIHTELGRSAFCYCAPHTWNMLQEKVQVDLINITESIPSVNNYNFIGCNCHCFSFFKWFFL